VKEERKDRTCKVCRCNDVEDECHFLLKCTAYNGGRARMYEKVRKETGYDMECMDDEWRMEAMIGDGVFGEEARKRIRKQVMRYILTAHYIRNRWL